MSVVPSTLRPKNVLPVKASSVKVTPGPFWKISDVVKAPLLFSFIVSSSITADTALPVICIPLLAV